MLTRSHVRSVRTRHAPTHKEGAGAFTLLLRLHTSSARARVYVGGRAPSLVDVLAVPVVENAVLG